MSQRESKLVRNSLNDIAPNNSNKAARGEGEPQGKIAPEKQKLKPLVKKGNVIKKKRTLLDKFKESFLGESENLGDYIVHDVLIPAFRDTISDMGIGVIERMFGNGRTRHSGSRSSVVRDRGRSYVTYNNSNDNRRGNSRDDSRRDLDRGSRARHSFENVIFTNQWEAEEVLSHLVDMIADYGEATVKAFYELSNMDSDYTDENYGWTNLRDAYVDRTRQGHVIIFPETRPL